MSEARRFRRKMERDVKKHMKNQGRYLDIPTEDDVQEYINTKIKELKIEPNGLQLQETTED